MEQKEHTINAEGKKLGRLASEVALLLRGKDSPSFSRNKVPGITVTVKNAKDLNINEKRQKSLLYKNFSGYPGGLKIRSAATLNAKKGNSELLRLAIKGMLPNNKLRPRLLKCLVITE